MYLLKKIYLECFSVYILVFFIRNTIKGYACVLILDLEFLKQIYKTLE